MIILKRKNFGFMDRLKGNPKLVDSYRDWEKNNKIIDEVKENPLFKKLPDGIKKHLSWLYLNLGDDELLRNIWFVSYDNIEKQLKGKSYSSFSIRKENRIVLAWASYNNNIIVAYYPEENVIKVTDEAARFNLIGRGLNKLIPTDRPEVYSPDELLHLLNTIKISVSY